MKHTKNCLLVISAFCAAIHTSFAQGLGSGSLFSRVDDQATKVTQAYAAIYENYYGVGKAWLMLKAALDVRPDGTPNITLDREAQKAQFTIRLSVNEPVYNAWKEDAHRRIEAVGMSVKFSDFEDTEARVIGGKFYRLGDNEESALRRWESSDKPAKKAELAVRVELVDSNGNAVRKVDLPISEFRRLGFDAFPLPLHNLNRLQDLPLDRYKWGNLDGMRRSLSDALRKADPNASIDGDSVEAIRRALAKAEENLDPSKRFKWGDVEDAYATFMLTELTDYVMNSIVDVRCTVIDDEILGREREEAWQIARERANESFQIARERQAAMLLEKQNAPIPWLLTTMIPIPDRNYLMGMYEVTQSQWEAVMGSNPSFFKGADNPVEKVSWDDCQVFLRKLNARFEVKESGLVFRLPTVSEWEHACRSGATGQYCKLADGTDITEDTLGRVAWYKDNSGNVTHTVGQKEPNAFGLYDMHGNVCEWCQEEIGEVRDFANGKDFEHARVLRGGSWHDEAKFCKVSSGNWWSSDRRFLYLGFRLCASSKAE